MEQLDERKKRTGLGFDVRDLDGGWRLSNEEGEEVGFEIVRFHAFAEEIDRGDVCAVRDVADSSAAREQACHPALTIDDTRARVTGPGEES